MGLIIEKNVEWTGYEKEFWVKLKIGFLGPNRWFKIKKMMTVFEIPVLNVVMWNLMELVSWYDSYFWKQKILCECS